MKKILCLCLLVLSTGLWAEDKWPIGFWNMLDDFTEQPEAIIEFYATPKGIEGKLNKVFYDNRYFYTQLHFNNRMFFFE